MLDVSLTNKMKEQESEVGDCGAGGRMEGLAERSSLVLRLSPSSDHLFSSLICSDTSNLI